MAKYLYIQGVTPSPVLEDFVNTGLAFFIDMASKNLGQKTRWDYPKPYVNPNQPVQQQQFAGVPLQQQIPVQGTGQPVQHVHVHQEQYPDDTAYTEVDTDVIEPAINQEEQDVETVFTNSMNEQIEQEWNILRRNMGKLSGAGQNVRSS